MEMLSIVPQNYLHLVEDNTMQLALVQFLCRPGYEKYTAFYRKQAHTANHTVILDNGMAENYVCTTAELLAAALDVGAQEIVVPDAYKDSYKTVLNCEKFMTAYEAYEAKQKPELFMVPQGLTMDEWVNCAKYLVQNYPVKTLGIPKHLVDTCGLRDARLFAISKLVERVSLDGINLHLLGCWKSPIEVLTVAKASHQGVIPMVRSCDSALAYVFARAGMQFADGDRPDSNPIDFKTGTCEEALLTFNLGAWKRVGTIDDAVGIN